MKASVLLPTLVAAAGFAFGYDIPANTTVNYTDISGQLSADEVVNVGANAIFDLNEQAVTLKAVTGFGTVSNGTLTLTLAGGPYTYSGKIFGDLTFARTDGATDDEFGFVLGASDTLAGAVYTEPNCAGSALRFAAGLGKARIQDYIATGNGQVLKVDDIGGKPVSVTATFHDDNLTTFSLYKLMAEGSGDVFTWMTGGAGSGTYQLAKGDTFKNVTGWVGPEHGRFQVAGPMDLSSVAGVRLGGEVDTDIYFYLPASAGDIFLPAIDGIGQTDFRTPVTIGTCTLKSSYLLTSSTLTVSNGNFSTVSGKSAVGPNAAASVYNMLNGSVGATYGLHNRSDSQIPRPTAGNWASAGRLNFHDGDIFFKQQLPDACYAYGGAFHLIGVMTGGTDAAPRLIHFDGGAFYFDATTQDGAGGGSVKYTSTSKDAFQMLVGEKGLTYAIDSVSAYYPPVVVNHLIRSDVADGVDGGIRFSAGLGSMEFTRPITVTGPVSLKDGIYLVGQTAEGKVFGSGALAMDGAGVLGYSKGLAAGTIALSEGGPLSYRGIWTIVANGGTGYAAQNWTIGPASAGSSSLVRAGKGSVLFLRNAATDGAAGGSVKVFGGVATGADGRVRDPIFMTANDATAARLYNGFACYSDAAGFTPFADYTEGVAGGADSVARISEAKTVLEGNATVAALRVDGISGVNPGTAQDQTASLVIPAETTLAVGRGTDPACVILNSLASDARAAIKGAGTLDFGAREGVIVANAGTGYAAGAIVNAKISGSAGLTLASLADGAPGKEVKPVIYLGGANDYSGGTWIGDALVIPGNSNAFGSGEIHLGDSQSDGGQIMIVTEGLNIPNNIRLAGRGTIPSYTRWGAIVLSDDLRNKINTAEFSGDIELVGRPRVMAHRNQTGSTLTFSGTLSGNDFEAWNTANAYHEDVKIVFTKPNVYTGLTQVIRQNLWLKEQGNTGTGGVELDGGKLVVDTDVPTTIRGTLSGVGTVVLKNKKAVTFEAFPEDSYSTLTLDVAGDGKRREVSSVRGFSAIVNSTGVPCDLYVNDLSGFTGTVDPSVNLIEGSGTRGMMLILR